MQFEQMTMRKQKSSLFCFHLLLSGTGSKAGKDQVHVVSNKLTFIEEQGHRVSANTGVMTHMTPGTRQGKYKGEACGDVTRAK